MKSTDIKNHKTSISQTHNLEVPGSIPGWSTLKIKHLRASRKCFFHVCVNKWRESAILAQKILSSFIEYFIHSLSYRKPLFLHKNWGSVDQNRRINTKNIT